MEGRESLASRYTDFAVIFFFYLIVIRTINIESTSQPNFKYRTGVVVHALKPRTHKTEVVGST